MPTVEHSTLTTTELHEPKGVAGAANNSVYVADGAGSGVWEPVFYTVSEIFGDISSAGTVYIPIPYAGTVKKIVGVIDSSIGTADAVLTVSNSAAASMGTITITQSGSAVGDVDTLSPVSNNTVTDDDYITMTTNAASTTTCTFAFTVVIERS